MPVLGCGAEMAKLMDVSDQDVAIIEDTIAERLALGISQAQAQRQAVDEALAQLADERSMVMRAVDEQLGFPVVEPVVDPTEEVAPEPVRGTNDAMGTPEFKKWFADSIAVDDAGKPLVVYHGTPTGGFTVFDPEKQGSKGGRARGGFSFTTDKKAAQSYADSFGEEANTIDQFVLNANSIWDKAVDRGLSDEAIESVGGDATDRFVEWDWQAYDDLDHLKESAEFGAEVLEKEGMVDLAKQMRAAGIKKFQGTPEVKEVYLNVPKGSPVFKATQETLGRVVAGLDVRSLPTRAAVVELEDGSRIFYVADSTQIKSATGNNGQFDSANPDIRFSNKSQTDTPKFKKWFGNSKVVDADGKPLVVYHGTGGDFNTFDMDYADREENWSFSTSKEVAQTYKPQALSGDKIWAKLQSLEGQARQRFEKQLDKYRDEDGEISESSAQDFAAAANEDDPNRWSSDLANAIDGNASDFYDGNGPGQIVEAYLSLKNPIERWFDGTNKVQRQRTPDGVTDGYIDHDVMDTNNPGSQRLFSTVYHVNSSEQIKSATGNSGAFDGSNPDIRFSNKSAAEQSLWVKYSDQPDAFRFGDTPEMRSKDISILAKAFSSDGTMLVGKGDADTGYNVALADHPDHTMTLFPQANGRYKIDATGASGPKGVLVGDNAGQRMYQALFAFAHNNWLKVDADYNLSYPNELRRTSAMLSSALRFKDIGYFGRVNSEQGVLNWDESSYSQSIEALADAELRKVESRVPRFADLAIDPETGEVYVDNEPLLEPGRAGASAGVPLDGRPAGDQQGRGGSDNLADLELRLAKSKAAARPTDGRPQNDVVRQTGVGELPAEGQSVSRTGVSDKELARYLASVGGGFESHGVGVSTLKRALVTRDHTETSIPKLQYANKSQSKWVGQDGRWQFAPGQMAWELLGEKAGPLLDRMYLRTASTEVRHAIRKMKLDQQKAMETTHEIVGAMRAMSADERTMISDIIEKELKAGVTPPASAIQHAAMMNEAFENQTNELVRLGMLTQEAADRWRGKYLPRYYESKLKGSVTDAWADLIKITKRGDVLKGIKGKHLRGRGMTQSISTDELADYEAKGWEIRDKDFDPAVDKTVYVWRDFTRAERDAMGEIRDAGFRFTMGYMQTQKDIALGRMYESIANNPDMSSRTQPDDTYVQVPTTNVPETGAKRYGKLAGRWVSRNMMSQLSLQQEMENDAIKLYRKALSVWKENKTVLNPVSHMNNFVSNLTMAHLAGVSYYDGHKYIGAIKDFAQGGGLIKEAHDAGLFLGSMSEEELGKMLPLELQSLVNTQDSKTMTGMKLAHTVLTWGLRRPAGIAYEFGDRFFKYLIYKDARKQGMEPNDAVDYAQKYIFTYDGLPTTARAIRDLAIPFFSYSYKAIPALAETALTHPHRMIAPAALLHVVSLAAYAVAAGGGGDDDSWMEAVKKYITDAEFRKKADDMKDEEYKLLPEWMKGRTSFGSQKTLRLGTDKTTGNPVFLDTSRFIPGGDLFDVTGNAGGIPWVQPLTPSNPLLSLYTAMIANKDVFTGKELVNKAIDTDIEAGKKRADWMWKLATPAIAINQAHWDRMVNAVAHANGDEELPVPDIIGGNLTGIGKDGMPVQAGYAAMNTIGIKARPMDLDMSEQIQKSIQNKTLAELDAQLRQARMQAAKGVRSDRNYQKTVDDINIKKERLKEGLTVDGNTKD